MAVKDDPGPQGSLEVICKRCNISTASLKIRAEQVCEKCFSHYVTTKAIKRMETYKSRGAAAKVPKRLLLPVSFGPSSTCLLAILDTHLQGQMDRVSRTTYELFVIHVDMDFKDTPGKTASAHMETLKERFPNHTYLAASLSQGLDLDIDWKTVGLDLPNFEVASGSDSSRLESLFNLISSSTSKADIKSTLLTRLLVDVAEQKGCESIIFGDSTTRLAEKTLIETAKGRGFSLPWQVSDGMSPYGVNFHYPLRDLLKKELIAFSSLTSSPLTDFITYQALSSQISASAKSTTIDDLMSQYFESVEENYPSIVANVVRTSSKLKAPVAGNIPDACGLCGLPVSEGTDGIYGWGGDQSSHARPNHHDAILCYGCSRSISDITP